MIRTSRPSPCANRTRRVPHLALIRQNGGSRRRGRGLASMLSSISPRASPKSQILAVLSGKMRMFPDLMSRCTTLRPRARHGVRWARCRRGGTRAWGRPCGGAGSLYPPTRRASSAAPSPFAAAAREHDRFSPTDFELAASARGHAGERQSGLPRDSPASAFLTSSRDPLRPVRAAQTSPPRCCTSGRRHGCNRRRLHHGWRAKGTGGRARLLQHNHSRV